MAQQVKDLALSLQVAAVAPVQSLTGELLCAMSAATGKKQKQTNKKAVINGEEMGKYGEKVNYK